MTDVILKRAKSASQRRRRSGGSERRGALVREIYFVARTPFGPMQLSLPWRALDERATTFAPIDHALALRAIEERIERIENWLRCPLDIEPGTRGETRGDALLMLLDPAMHAGALTLYIPGHIWPRLPAPPSATDIAPCKLEWATLRGRMIIADLTIDEGDAAALGTGALVLIPESFGGRDWWARIEIPALRLTMTGRFDVGERRWTKTLDADGWHLAPIREQAPSTPPVKDLRVTLPLTLSALELIGSAKTTSVSSEGDAHNQLWEVLPARDKGEATPSLGHLVPLLSGHGIQIISC